MNVTSTRRCAFAMVPVGLLLATVAVGLTVGTVSPAGAAVTAGDLASHSAGAHLTTTNSIFRVAGTVAASSVTLKGGDLVVYHVTVTDSGGSPGRTTLSDPVPAHTSYVGISQGWSCPRHSSAGTACTQNVSLTAGETLAVHYTVLVDKGRSFSSITDTVTTSAGTCTNCTVTTGLTQESASGRTLAYGGIDATGDGVVGSGLLGAGVLLAFLARRRRPV